MVGGQHTVTGRLAWDKFIGNATLLDCTIPLKGLVQVIVDNKAHAHDALVINRSNHTDELWLELCQSAVHVFHGLAILTRLELIDDLVCEVNISLNKIHIVDKLFELRGNTGGRATLAVSV